MEWRRKPVELCLALAERTGLRRSLGPVQLTLMGVGAIVGSGIFVLVAIGSERAGPALILSFAIAALVCGLTALAYAELAALVPAAGSAYTYSYVALGEFVAWLVGWNLVLEYAIAASGLAVGWSGYINGLLHSLGIDLPLSLRRGCFAVAGGGVDVPAVLVVTLVVSLIALDTKASARVSTVLVVVKIAALLTFLAATLPHVQWHHFEPFMPYGFWASEIDGSVKGVMAAAALMFFAYLGFDTVSTAAEEARDPRRTIPIGIIGSLGICTLLYLLVAVGTIGTTPYQQLRANPEALAWILRHLGREQLGNLVAVAAIIALPTVLLMLLFGFTRICFAMARDGLIPPALSRVSSRFGTPFTMTICIGALVGLVAAFYSVDEIVELSNAGTLFSFIAVALSALVMRYREPDRPRHFRCPALWLLAPLAIVGCSYLLFSLPAITHRRFVIWSALGIGVYAAYGCRRSALKSTLVARGREAGA